MIADQVVGTGSVAGEVPSPWKADALVDKAASAIECGSHASGFFRACGFASVTSYPLSALEGKFRKRSFRRMNRTPV
jgi:hypothetical protein